MSRTTRCWTKIPPTKWDREHWKRCSMSVFGYHKARRIRKEMRKSIRCVNRTMFAHGMFEPILEIWGEYFD